MIEVSPSHQLLSAAQIYKMFSISKTTFYRWIDEGFFEPGLRLGPNCVRWRASTVNAFIEKREKQTQREVHMLSLKSSEYITDYNVSYIQKMEADSYVD